MEFCFLNKYDQYEAMPQLIQNVHVDYMQQCFTAWTFLKLQLNLLTSPVFVCLTQKYPYF